MGSIRLFLSIIFFVLSLCCRVSLGDERPKDIVALSNFPKASSQEISYETQKSADRYLNNEVPDIHELNVEVSYEDTCKLVLWTVF